MAVISCVRHREGRQGSRGARFDTEYSAVWRVVTNNDDDGPLTVIANGAFTGPEPTPVIGAVYLNGNDSDGNAFCDRLSADQQEKIRHWLVTAHYRHLEPGEEYGDLVSENPLTRPVLYRLEHEHWTKVVEKDKDGDAIKNSAGVQFDTGVELDDSYLVLVAEKNFATLQEIIDLNTQFSLKVNNAIYRGGAVRTWLCRPITSSDIQTENGITFYRATFHLVYNPAKWDVEVIDRGFLENDGAVWRGALEKNKQPVGEPVPLDGMGRQLASNLPLVFLSFRIRGEVAFSGLGV